MSLMKSAAKERFEAGSVEEAAARAGRLCATEQAVKADKHNEDNMKRIRVREQADIFVLLC